MGPQGPGSGKRAVGTGGHHGPPWASSELGLTSGATTSLLLPPKKKGETLQGRWVLSARRLVVYPAPFATTGDRMEDKQALQPFLLKLKLELGTQA